MRIPACSECGAEPVHHWFERWSIVMNAFTQTVLAPLAWLGRCFAPLVNPLIHQLAPLAFRTLAFFRIGTLHTMPDERDALMTNVLWEEAQKKGIKMYQFRPFGLPRNIFWATHAGRSLVFDGLPRLDGFSPSAAWMDDKAKLKKKFVAKKFPVARGGTAFTFYQALKIFHELFETQPAGRQAVVVKPHIGSGTRHTTLHITTQDELRRAFAIAKQLSPLVVVEEELLGDVYRPTVIGGKLIAVLQRKPPEVIGDGVHTVEELIAIENVKPQRQGPIFGHISICDDLIRELQYQNLTLESVPKKYKTIRLHQKINWSLGGITKDLTDVVHPDNKKLFEDIALYIDDPIVGIDFIIPDITKSWKLQRCGVIECNSLPFIDNHHYPFEGRPRNVAGAIWELVFPSVETPRFTW